MQITDSLALASIAILLVGKLIPKAPAHLVDKALAGHLALVTLWIAVLVWSLRKHPEPLLGSWSLRWVPIGVVLAVGLFVVGAVGYLVSQRGLGLEPPPESTLVQGAGALRFCLLLAVALIAAVLEEWVFRGVLLERLEILGGASAVLVSAAAFAAYHLSLFQLVPTFLLGLALGVIVSWLGSLWPAVIAHAGFNLLGLSLTMLGTGGGQAG